MSVILTVLFVAFVAILLLLVLSCVKLSTDISRYEEQQNKSKEQQNKCNECKYFMICESGKQYFFAVTGTECEEFERAKE